MRKFNVLNRLKQLESKLNKEYEEEKYEQAAVNKREFKLDSNELLEYRTLRQICNVLTSRTNSSTIGANELKYLLKQLNWSSRGLTKGKFV